MQRKDVERLTHDCTLASKALHDTGTFETGQTILREAAAALGALLAERDALRAAIFGGTDYATDLTNGNFVEMAQTTEAARLGALARAEKAEAERDAAFAAGQEEMRERAAKAYDAGMAWDTFGAFTRCLRALPIKPRPDGR